MSSEKRLDELTMDERALPVPQQIDAAAEKQSMELARVWWDGARPQMTVRPALTEHRHVGLMLAELAWHNADKYAGQRGGQRDDYLRDIRQAFITMLDEMAPGSRPGGAN